MLSKDAVERIPSARTRNAFAYFEVSPVRVCVVVSIPSSSPVLKSPACPSPRPLSCRRFAVSPTSLVSRPAERRRSLAAPRPAMAPSFLRRCCCSVPPSSVVPARHRSDSERRLGQTSRARTNPSPSRGSLEPSAMRAHAAPRRCARMHPAPSFRGCPGPATRRRQRASRVRRLPAAVKPLFGTGRGPSSDLADRNGPPPL